MKFRFLLLIIVLLFSSCFRDKDGEIYMFRDDVPRFYQFEVTFRDENDEVVKRIVPATTFIFEKDGSIRFLYKGRRSAQFPNYLEVVGVKDE